MSPSTGRKKRSEGPSSRASREPRGGRGLTRQGAGNVRDRGAFILTSGIPAQSPSPESAAVRLVNAGLAGFVGVETLQSGRSGEVVRAVR